MKILLIDTCGTQGNVAIADTSYVPAEIASATLPGRSASEKLIGAIRGLAKTSGIPLYELNAIAVVNGPGSFTGVRIGLSAAKGLCEALSVPLVAISRLAVLASQADAGPDATVFAVLDAGRGEFYAGEYQRGEKVREVLVSYEEISLFLRELPAPTDLVACEDSVASTLASLQPLVVAEPGALAALPLAMRKIGHDDFADVESIDANYLRRTDLELFAKTKARLEATAG